MTHDNKAIQDITQQLSNVCSLSYARSDVSALIAYNTEKMIGHLMEVMANQFRSTFAGQYGVPTAELWTPLKVKAYDELIALCEQQLVQLQQDKNALTISSTE